jgi:hypothetical protein
MYTQVKKNVMKFRSTLHGGYYSEHNLLFYQPQVLARMSRLRIFISICSQAYISPVFNKVDNKPFFFLFFFGEESGPHVLISQEFSTCTILYTELQIRSAHQIYKMQAITTK